MQTFLPFPDFAKSAEVLDRQRLGKQRIEVTWILGILGGTREGSVADHPACLMWDGYERALCEYGRAIVAEWTRRGYVNNQVYDADRYHSSGLPQWFGIDRYHASWRSVLLFKNPTHYGQFDWTEQPAEKFDWPVRRPERVWIKKPTRVERRDLRKTGGGKPKIAPPDQSGISYGQGWEDE
jgi:Pyrimidine dimer DNA glycosylase